MSFAKDIASYAERTKLSIDDAINSINIQATELIQLKTPVDTGMARTNWIASIGTPSSNTTTSTNSSAALGTAKGIAGQSAGKVFYLSNNLPYIRRLEYGWSTQAPSGMVRLSMIEIKLALRKYRESR